MGILIYNPGDPTQHTPVYSTNAAGNTSWSGKHVSELTAMDLVAILQFCRDEASRLGWNDANAGRADCKRINPFDARLLGGYPHEEWAAHYKRGVCGFAEAVSAPDEFHPSS